VGVIAHADTATNIQSVTIKLRLAAGSPDIVMENVVVRTIVAGTPATYVDGDAGYDYDLAVVGQGDLLTITIGETGAFLTLTNLDTMEISVSPAFGQPTYISFMVPEVLTAGHDYMFG
jgi:archaellin